MKKIEDYGTRKKKITTSIILGYKETEILEKYGFDWERNFKEWARDTAKALRRGEEIAEKIKDDLSDM